MKYTQVEVMARLKYKAGEYQMARVGNYGSESGI